MSVLRRAFRAASDLRGQLDLDAVRDAVRTVGEATRSADADAVDERPTASSPLDDRAVVVHARALGALGAPAGPPRLTHGDDTIGVVVATSTGPAGALSVSAFHASERDADFDVATHWNDVVAPVVADDAHPVPGVGRAALRTVGGLYVLGDAHLLYLTLARPDGASADAALGALARAVLARLEPRG